MNSPLFHRFCLLSIVLSTAFALNAVASPIGSRAPRKSSDKPRPITPVQVPQGQELATFAAGCFWSMEALFEELKGVQKVEPGYAGGYISNPNYQQVCEGITGHAETVNIFFDPKVVSYRALVEIMLTVRNPTTLNRQGADEGTNYRSAIFYHNEEQKKCAQEAMEQMTTAHIWRAPIVTEVTGFTNFYAAEDDHRDYYQRHLGDSYARLTVLPAIVMLREKFPSKVKTQLK
jgi:peptide-methionine (S)-S-oxide reductase